MARMPRIIVPGQALHVIQRGNNRQAVFFADEDYQYYLDVLAENAANTGCQIHAYMLMTNHTHLLLTPASENSVSRMMQGIGRKYVRYINKIYRRSGTLWEGRFRSALVDSDRYLLTCSRYIELNPVRASMVNHPEKYRWSSYHGNALGKVDRCISPHDIYLTLGREDEARQEAYRGLFNTTIDAKELELIREATQQCTVIGNEKFQEEIAHALKRRVIKLGHGGDRKSEIFGEISSVLTP